MHREDLAIATAGLSPSQQRAVRETLQEILNSSLFGKSKRYSALLEYVVLNSLAGNLTALKERVVGKEVFGRPADYDVANDPVVRIAAGEVRKRLTQFFSERPDKELRIDLPTGGYAADFCFDRQRHSRPAESNPAQAQEPPAKAHAPAPTTVPTLPAKTQSPVNKPVIAAFLILVIAGAAWVAYLNYRNSHDFWRPFLRNSPSPLIVVGRTHLPAAAGPQFTQPTTAGRAQLVLDDAMLVAQLCSIFRAYSADCNIVLAPATTLDYLHGKPIILLGGFNNDWTMRMMPSLRYQLQSADENDNALGFRTIAEHKPSGDTPLWNLYGENIPPELGKDYAIVARFHSDITNGMVMIAAGLGPEGTAGAREFLTSPEDLSQLISRAPKDWRGTNLEAVLQIDVVHGSASRAEVVATNFW